MTVGTTEYLPPGGRNSDLGPWGGEKRREEEPVPTANCLPTGGCVGALDRWKHLPWLRGCEVEPPRISEAASRFSYSGGIREKSNQ